ncbi:MAG: amidinotransferase, partial [Flavobacteriales bacterium]|nr:amidinotransferase [Flavobacteriales bacterium]
MIEVKVDNEYSALKSVILGLAEDMGDPPKVFDVYDPRSLYHIKNNSYPSEVDVKKDVESFYKILIKHNVDVLRPDNIKNCNQVFARDLGFTISNIFFQSNIVPNREEELVGVSGIINSLDAGVVKLPDYMHIEGGDVVIHNNKLFIGTYSGEDYSELITARTNQESISYLEKMIPSKEIMSINIKKSNTDVFENVLHLDCCFQPIGKRKAIICPDSFVNKSDVEYLIGYFGKKNTYLAYGQEAYML